MRDENLAKLEWTRGEHEIGDRLGGWGSQFSSVSFLFALLSQNLVADELRQVRCSVAHSRTIAEQTISIAVWADLPLPESTICVSFSPHFAANCQSSYITSIRLKV